MSTPPIHETEADVFILESLGFHDETEEKLDGKILAQTLKLMGKKPIYHYFRTRDELEMLALMFRESGYRYLHFSCHGSLDKIELTMESISYIDFSDIFAGLLRNRRATFSACELGNELFSEILAGRNIGMYSIAAPAEKITFEKSSSFWGAFYVRLFSLDTTSMKGGDIKSAITKICDLLSTRFHLSRYVPSEKKLKHELIEGSGQYLAENAIRNTIRTARHFLVAGDYATSAKISALAMEQAALSPYLLSRAKAVLAYALVAQGDTRKAIPLLREVVDYRGMKRAKPWHLAPLAYSYLKTGDALNFVFCLLQIKANTKANFDLSSQFSYYPGIAGAYNAIPESSQP